MDRLVTLGRRLFLALTGAGLLCPAQGRTRAHAQAVAPGETLLDAPIELGGDWRSAPIDAVMRVVSRVRAVDLSGFRLLSDRQPKRIHVENHTQGLPAIWLHSDQPDTASIIVDVGYADWCKLAYQFGHELGHVLCNSWQSSAKPRLPTQWLEEALVETFSIRGLGLLADSWEKSPPFAGDAGFAAAIRRYRSSLLDNYKAAGEGQPSIDAAAWFHANRADLEGGNIGFRGPAINDILLLYENARAKQSCIEDLGALNRWPERTSVPVENYLERWAQSCAEIGACGELPSRLKELFRLA